eukprot:TRINITY_DN53976_c0_g1_i1.p1 TRINITY_DN53976_c0_g1~~TRINITY_DN53976_c0_g1_i1.p1  ORF type:complete len:396 (+),score=27.44 TRINITY_DN53976_c0_g1_i1:75-1190(+)
MWYLTLIAFGLIIGAVGWLLWRRYLKASPAPYLSMRTWQCVYPAVVGRELEHPVFGNKDELKLNLKKTVHSYLTCMPPGLKLAAADGDGRIRIIDASSRSVEREVPHRGRVVSVAWNPAGDILVSGTCRGSMHIFGVNSDFKETTVRLGHWVGCVSWHPAGTCILAGCRNGQVFLVDVSGEILSQRDCRVAVLGLSWNCLGDRVALCCEDGRILVSSIVNSRIHALEWSVTMNCAVRAIAWEPRGPVLAAGGDDGKLRLWNGLTGELLRLSIIGPEIRVLAWKPFSTDLVVGGNDGNLWLGDRTKRSVFEIERVLHRTPDEKEISAVAWHPSGKQIAVAHRDGGLQLVAESGHIVGEMDFGEWTWGLAWNP